MSRVSRVIALMLWTGSCVASTSGQSFAHVCDGRDFRGVVVEPAVELPACLLVGVEAWVGEDLVVGVERWVIAVRLASHHRRQDRFQARGLGALEILVSFGEFRHDLASEQ